MGAAKELRPAVEFATGQSSVKGEVRLQSLTVLGLAPRQLPSGRSYPV